MRLAIAAAAFLTLATSAEAETWTCSYTHYWTPYVGQQSAPKSPTFLRFELSPPDLIDTSPSPLVVGRRYRILQNNEYGLVAALSISEIEEGQKDPTVGAVTVMIKKDTGDFWLGVAFLAEKAGPSVSTVQGKCLKG
jgi:hypothetical protein